MESKKVKEIKKALECCINNKGCNLCTRGKLPYDLDECRLVLTNDILTLINELESENEKLRKENETLRNAKVVYETVDYCYEDLKKAEKRIAELEKGNEALSFALEQGFNDCQTKTLKQFAERLIEKKVKLGDRFNIYDIDETLKEFIK